MGHSYSKRYNIGHVYTIDGYMWLVEKETTAGGKYGFVTLNCLGKSFTNNSLVDKYKMGQKKVLRNQLGRVYDY